MLVRTLGKNGLSLSMARRMVLKQPFIKAHPALIRMSRGYFSSDPSHEK